SARIQLTTPSEIIGTVVMLAIFIGTLLRSKSVPGGTAGYLIGEITANFINTLATSVTLLIVGLFLFDGLDFASPARWLLFITVLVLGLISTLSIGAVLGALMSNPKFMGLVMMGLIAIS